MSVLRWTVMATHVPPGGSLGGVVRYTTELIRALAERDDVVVSALTTRAAADTLAEIVGTAGRVHTLPNVPTAALSLVERRAPLARLEATSDVIHGAKHLVPARSAALRVLTVHDMLLLDRTRDFGPVKSRLLPGPYRASIQDADLLLCVSDATRTRLVAHAPSVAARARTVRLAPATSLRTAEPAPVAVLARRRFALVVGDASARKNLRTLVSAWGAVRRRHPDVALAIAGPPNWGRTVVGRAYDALVAAGAVVPLGQVSDAELRWAYEHADVVLCPSLAEGFGLPAAEALHCGAPLIVSSDPALQEVAGGRALAVVAPLDIDAWIAAIDDALTHPVAGARESRTWADVADETVQAVRAARDLRAGGRAGGADAGGGAGGAAVLPLTRPLSRRRAAADRSA